MTHSLDSSYSELINIVGTCSEKIIGELTEPWRGNSWSAIISTYKLGEMQLAILKPAIHISKSGCCTEIKKKKQRKQIWSAIQMTGDYYIFISLCLFNT